MEPRELTIQEYMTEAYDLFGPDMMTWRFVCPACGHIASVADYKAAGAPESAVGFSCIGRWLENPREAFGKGPGPCDYAGGGLFRIAPIKIGDKYYFDLDRSRDKTS